MENVPNESVRKTDELLRDELKVINIGLTLFADSLKAQGVQVAHVSWQPPARGNAELADLLNDLL